VEALPLASVTVTVRDAGKPGCAAVCQAPADDTFAANPVLVPPAFVRVVAPNVTFAVPKFPVMIAPPSDVADTPVGVTFPLVAEVATAHDHAPVLETFAANPVAYPPEFARVVDPNVTSPQSKSPVMIAPPSSVTDTAFG
jgi:hypothetical protein